ncbi:Uncharacterised protein [Budvicia aquatica]|uniref:Uncharacterized protein n=1 Tax=Budvicia aquatica TaxID=82979 RepID=A0A2C6DRV8_9GAMM|nr:hypothetical protein CRN84_17850 [Budvicia aquatica]VFS51283.1 Uncharacterised protein [Budvicia aquatica]
MRKPIPLDLASYKSAQLDSLIYTILEVAGENDVPPHLSQLISIAHDMSTEITESLRAGVSA